ncbi:hypothetical protein ACSXDC_10735 [Clostridium perfringens]|uniref:hypothetical protein n=1 Tax=Clostridium perfringens TaxID=1502 RepID=UPI001A2BCEE7|nr:hypothetical protein [Clostridium perfringens]MBO3420204.1 hypothetical protein [Clostridium perfringens]MDM0577818.1 hypothetical protein [Clostridium perfringens]HAT4182212.1 hypothetical protein [Clostridium perfringens]
MSSVITIVSNADGNISISKMDSTGFKFEALNLKEADISSLKVSDEISIVFDPIKASIETLDVNKIKKGGI